MLHPVYPPEVLVRPRARARAPPPRRRSGPGSAPAAATVTVARPGPGTAAAPASASAAAVPATASALSSRHLDADTVPAEPGAVESPDGVLGVPVVLELDECEAGRVPGDPHVPQRTVLGEGVLDVVLARVVPEVADVHLAGDIPVAMAARHDGFAG